MFVEMDMELPGLTVLVIGRRIPLAIFGAAFLASLAGVLAGDDAISQGLSVLGLLLFFGGLVLCGFALALPLVSLICSIE